MPSPDLAVSSQSQGQVLSLCTKELWWGRETWDGRRALLWEVFSLKIDFRLTNSEKKLFLGPINIGNAHSHAIYVLTFTRVSILSLIYSANECFSQLIISVWGPKVKLPLAVTLLTMELLLYLCTSLEDIYHISFFWKNQVFRRECPIAALW